MSLALIIYLIEVADNLSGAASAVCFFAFLVAFAAGLIACLEHNKDVVASAKKAFRISLLTTILFGAICIVTPSKDTAYAMLAAYGVQSIAENKQVQKLAPKSLEMLNKAMDEYLQDDKESEK